MTLQPDGLTVLYMSDNEEVEDDGRKVSRDYAYEDFKPGMVNAIAGTPAAVPLPQVKPLPPAEQMLCAKGPCKHYWKLVTLGPDGDPDGLKQHHHTCLVQPGRETDLGDDFVFECNRYEPEKVEKE